MAELAGLLLILFIVSFLYSSIGHGGASGYIAVLSILGWSNETIRPAALVLNVFVATISFIQYYRGGHFKWKLFFQVVVDGHLLLCDQPLEQSVQTTV